MKNKILSIISIWIFTIQILNAQVFFEKNMERDGTVTSIRFRTDTIPVSMSKAKEVLNTINKMQTADGGLKIINTCFLKCNPD